MGIGLLVLVAGAALAAWSAESEHKVRVAVAGDVWLKGTESGKSPFRHVTSLLKAADVAIINLEGPLTKRTEATSHKSAKDLAAKEQYIVKGSPAYAHYLPEAGIDVATLANNHTMDFLAGGCQDTIELLDKLGVATCGAGATATAARRPALVKTGDGHVAVLSYLAFVSAGGLAACTPATATHAGVAVVRSGGDTLGKTSRAALKHDIARAKEQAGIVIVVFHWGVQKESKPVAYHRAVARAAAELGASAVVGHHPHVLQGIEWYKGVPILYSLGNFVFSPATGPLGETGVAELHFEDGKATRVDFHPARIRDRTPKPLTGEAARKLSQRLLDLSRGLRSVKATITKEGVLRIPRP
jgi:poly-gamma-glutamate synthesis protein (capsule biosynthesis protein)